ncbi:class I SAM-dependent methyltransferase [Hyunsoonleella flava]|uniref:Class I SAM-dependent methyltransferase n=1 Tax=Hyunsoonleella flava TaxID=2527939 RepID=A0A4Q9FDE3_9FLAO|nr:class I SAM-dependent methyltransferase [Hyunsoonleella flava]TBN03589.1 class I SAM-dependent methyltransferase [Hyunsoonleella flava]
MSNLNTSYIGLRDDLVKYIEGSHLKILDVGCATGTNGKYLLDQKIAAMVVGVEYNDLMAKDASKYYDEVFVGDLNSDEFVERITKQKVKFDYILFGDVLEHLINPLDVLKKLKTLLNSDGKVIISVPNIAHLELFIQVFVKGTWPKNKRGIFDSTHLRWFTKYDIHQLVKDANLNVIQYEPKLRARDAIGSKFGFWTKILRWVKKDWVTFQHILVCGHVK